jgi:hypothetical protein
MEPLTNGTTKRNGNVQLNLNTILLAICMGLSGWVLFSINQLDEKLAGMMPLINANSTAILDVNKLDREQSQKIEDLSTRLTKLETMAADHLSTKQ